MRFCPRCGTERREGTTRCWTRGCGDSRARWLCPRTKPASPAITAEPPAPTRRANRNDDDVLRHAICGLEWTPYRARDVELDATKLRALVAHEFLDARDDIGPASGPTVAQWIELLAAAPGRTIRARLFATPRSDWLAPRLELRLLELNCAGPLSRDDASRIAALMHTLSLQFPNAWDIDVEQSYVSADGARMRVAWS